MASFTIIEDDLRGVAIGRLLREHLSGVAEHSPPESIHALSIDDLRAPGVTFWSAWLDGDLAGCGALKQLDGRHAEIKSMRTAAPHLRNGVAAAVLTHILEVARQRGCVRVSLETGAQDGFAPARALYTRFGFVECGPFADYVDDPNSVFMTLTLDEA